ncbi:hypothetical protein AB6A40_008699 [Gnathostoma spinigerum]|uniref:Uncharacterized protein n=1 Tax=Gnathostoma spinigerum TaxID=75299 RepID=A0ABD6F041_9BILA
MASDEDDQVDASEPEEGQEESNDESAPVKPPADIKSPTPGKTHALPTVPKSKQKKTELYSAGKPSKHDKEKLMRSEGIIPIQAGSNKYASQRGMTGWSR